MSRLLIPDSGPLFSLATANLLPLLGNFRVGITDVVREETVDRGSLPNASVEAQRLLVYYNQNAPNIETFATQVGIKLAASRALDPNYRTPRNLGELSIQSLLIDLQMTAPGSNPVVLFEDSWFFNHASILTKPCIVLSTQAFLEYAQSKKWIKSAREARRAIARTRPYAYAKSYMVRHD